MLIAGDNNTVTGNRTGAFISQSGLNNAVGPAVNASNITSSPPPYANFVD